MEDCPMTIYTITTDQAATVDAHTGAPSVMSGSSMPVSP